MQLEYWQQIVAYAIGATLLVWLITTIYQGIRYKILQVLSFILILMSMVLNIGEYPGPMYFEKLGFILSIVAIAYVLLGIIMTKKNWVHKRGTKNLTKFSNLMIYAYVRHPVTWGVILASIALLFLNHSILSNALAVVATILLTLSSFEKDLYMASLFGYPYRVYMEKVPRFSLIFSIFNRINKAMRKRNKY